MDTYGNRRLLTLLKFMRLAKWNCRESEYVTFAYSRMEQEIAFHDCVLAASLELFLLISGLTVNRVFDWRSMRGLVPIVIAAALSGRITG